MLADVFGKGLPHQIALYVPHTTAVREALEESAVKPFVERTLRFFSERFGGATAVAATGSWIAEDGTLVTEQVTIVYVFCPDLSRDDLERIRTYAGMLKQELRQEAVAVEIDGALFFV